jgi:hypothetical protein
MDTVFQTDPYSVVFSSTGGAMDKDRQFRMLIPPFFLFASVLWEAYLSGDLWQYMHNTASTEAGSLKSVLSLLTVLGVATLPAGYGLVC